MKKITYSILGSLIFLGAFQGCIETVEPYGSTITQEQLEANKSVILSSMANAIPASMTAADLVGTNYQTDFGLPAIHIMTESLLEDFVCKGEAFYDQFVFFVTAGTGGPTDPEGTYYWYAYYKWIKMANDIISIVNPKTDNPEELYYLGQAYAYRAMCYLDLARLYEPKQNKYMPVGKEIEKLTVPILTEKTTQEEATNNPRVDRETMYKFILEDLRNAEKALETAAKANIVGNFSSPNINAVAGLFARTYLEMGYWKDEKSAEYFTLAKQYAEATTKNYFPLSEAQWHDVNSGFNSGSTNESWIWGLTLSSSNTNNLMNFTAMVSNEAQFGYGPLIFRGTTPEFYNAISDGDFRKESFIDPDWDVIGGETPHNYLFSGTTDDANRFLSSMVSTAGPYVSIKFRPAMGKTMNSTLGITADHPVMRVEEMYFIAMEAALYTKGVSEAKKLLEEFMNNYRMTEGTYTCPETVTDEASFLKEMLLQKRAEFWGEGILIYDYKRIGAPIYRVIIDEAGPNAAVSKITTERSPQWNMNIPRREIQNNNGITQELNNPDPTGFMGEALPQ